MNFITSMDDIRELLNQENVLMSVKRIGIFLYGNDSIFSDEATTIDDCLKRLKALANDEKKNFPDYILVNVNDVHENFDFYVNFYEKLIDEQSRKILVNLLAYRLTFNEYYMAASFSAGERQYFGPTFMKYKPNGVFVDCGALNGATTLEYARHIPNFKHAYVYEPLPQMYQACVRNLSVFSKERVTIRQAAVSSHKGRLHFDSCVEGSSHISNEGSMVVEAICLDEDISEPVDFIKMDIEGAEQAAIEGAQNHIRNDRPVLAISIYHLPADLHAISQKLLALCPDYHFCLRHHMPDASEIILYGFPVGMETRPENGKKNNISEFADLVIDEYMNVQTLQKEYILSILKQTTDAKEAHLFFEKQYREERAAHMFFYKQCLNLQDKVNSEKEAHEFFEKQLKDEKTAHTSTQETLKAEKEAHSFFEKQLLAEKEAHSFFEKQLLAEKKAHDFFEQQLSTEKETRLFFEQQLADEQAAHKETKAHLNSEKEAHLFFEEQYNTEKKAHGFFEQQLNHANRRIENIQQELEHQKHKIKSLEENVRSLKNDNSKLNYKLQILKNDFLIEKIIRIKKYDI